MTQLRMWLRGRKTYLVAAGAIIATVAAWAAGDIETAAAVQAIVGALLAATIRAGVNTAAKPPLER